VNIYQRVNLSLQHSSKNNRMIIKIKYLGDKEGKEEIGEDCDKNSSHDCNQSILLHFK
jgi:hypothetical protein